MSCNIYIENLKINDKLLIKNLNFKLKNGETIFVVGANGVGKTVLFNILAGWDKNIIGLDIQASIDIDSNKFIIPKEHNHYRSYAKKYIQFSSNRYEEESLGITLEEEIELIENYFDTIPAIIKKSFNILFEKYLKNQKIKDIAHGHKQLLAITDLVGRSLNARLVLIDEPTNFISDKLVEHIKDLIDYISIQNKKVKIIIISHDNRILKNENILIQLKKENKKTVDDINILDIEKIPKLDINPYQISIYLEGKPSFLNTIYKESIKARIDYNNNIIITGDNGTGKSVFLKSCAGLIKIKGEQAFFDKNRNKIKRWNLFPKYFGYLFQNPYSYEFRQQVNDFFVKPKNMSKNNFIYYKTIIFTFLDYYDIKKDDYPRNLSTGQLRILWIFSQIPWGNRWFLDEPDAGLDITSIKILKKILSIHIKYGGSFILITHNIKVYHDFEYTNLVLKR